MNKKEKASKTGKVTPCHSEESIFSLDIKYNGGYITGEGLYQAFKYRLLNEMAEKDLEPFKEDIVAHFERLKDKECGSRAQR